MAQQKKTTKKSMPTASEQAEKRASVFTQAYRLVDKVEQLEKARASNLALLLAAEQKVATARRNYGTATALAIQESPNGHLPHVAESLDLEEAKADLEQAELSMIAVMRSIRKLDREGWDLVAPMRQEYIAYRENILRMFLAQNQALIEQWRNFQRQTSALNDALGLTDIIWENSTKPLAELLAQPPATDWTQDETATKLHRDHRDPFRLLGTIERLASQEQYRAARPESYPGEAVAIPRTRYLVRKPIRLHGNDIFPGAVVSAFTVPDGNWGVLRKLAQSGHVQPVEIE